MNNMLNKLIFLLDIHYFFWFCAIIGTFVFIVQMASFFIKSPEKENQNNPLSLKYLSFQAASGFLILFGWVGLTCKENFTLYSHCTIAAAVFLGAFFSILIAIVISRLIQKNQSGQNVFAKTELEGKEAIVHDHIPKEGMGKVLISLKNQLLEVDAIGQDGQEIRSYAHVCVVKKLNDCTVIVSPKNKPMF